jgi:hypothetical protein
VVDEVWRGDNNGRITGASLFMQYRIDGVWTNFAGTQSPLLPPSTYQVRFRATEAAFASSAVDVVIQAGPSISDSISLSESGTIILPAVTVGYGTQAQRNVTITNTSDRLIDSLTIALTGTNRDAFVLSANEITNIAGGGSRGFSVAPRTGLIAGSYTATIEISRGNTVVRSVNVSFEVRDIAPVINTSWLARGVLEEQYNHQISATGTNIRWSSSGLPAGLSIIPETGWIFGTPLVDGRFSVTVWATNSVGSVSRTFTLEVYIPINNVDELARIGGAQSQGKFYLLKRHITASDWTPINDFRGTLDGGGHTITLRVPRNRTTRDGENANGFRVLAGLFGHIRTGTVNIQNLGILAPKTNAIFADRSANTSGTQHGFAGGFIAFVSGSNTTVNIINCFVNGNIEAYTNANSNGWASAGGLIGGVFDSTVNIWDSFAAGSVNAQARSNVGYRNYSSAGGFIGDVWGNASIRIDRCYVINSVRAQGAGTVINPSGPISRYAGGFLVADNSTSSVTISSSFRANSVEGDSNRLNAHPSNQGMAIPLFYLFFPDVFNPISSWDTSSVWIHRQGGPPTLRVFER